MVPYCPRCGTPLSDHEVALGYDEPIDPSVFVRMPLVDEPDTSLLVWTTTPWTLPANVAVAAHPDVDYVTVERDLPEGGTERLILAEALLEKVFGDEPVKVVERYQGQTAEGQTLPARCSPSCRPINRLTMWCWGILSPPKMAPAWCISPRLLARRICRLALEEDLPILMTVAEDGTFHPGGSPLGGQVCQRCRSVHHPGPAGARPAVPRRNDYPYLSVLLALQHPAAVLCPPDLVYPHQPVQRPPGGAERADQLVPGPHQEWAFWQLAGK